MQIATRNSSGERDERPTEPLTAQHVGRDRAAVTARFYVPDTPKSAKAVQPKRSEAVDLRQELYRRVETFRARLQVAQAERDAHYDATIKRMKAITTEWSPVRIAQRAGIEPCRAPDRPANTDRTWDSIWQGIEQMTDRAKPATHLQD